MLVHFLISMIRVNAFQLMIGKTKSFIRVWTITISTILNCVKLAKQKNANEMICQQNHKAKTKFTHMPLWMTFSEENLNEMTCWSLDVKWAAFNEMINMTFNLWPCHPASPFHPFLHPCTCISNPFMNHYDESKSIIMDGWKILMDWWALETHKISNLH